MGLFTQIQEFCHLLTLKLFQTSMNFFLLLNTRLCVTKQLMVTILFIFHTMEVNRDRQLFGYPHSSKYFKFNRRNNFIRIWNNFRVSKWWQIFHFGVNYPFNNNNKINWEKKLNHAYYTITCPLITQCCLVHEYSALYRAGEKTTVNPLSLSACILKR